LRSAMQDKFELRSFGLEFRGRDQKRLIGYAAIFDSVSDDLGGFYEVISPGAFAESLADRSQDIVLAWAHDLSRPLASRNAGTLDLREDGKGLAIEAALNGTTWAADALAAIESGTVTKMSFMFRTRPGGDKWRREGGRDIRTVTSAQLFEVSPVVFPAYSATSVATRSAAEILSGRPALADLQRMALESKRRGIGF